MNIGRILQGIDDLLYGLAVLIVQLPRTFVAVLVHPVRYAELRRVQSDLNAEQYVAPGAFLGAVLGVVALSAPLMDFVRKRVSPGLEPAELAAGLHPLFGDEARLSTEMELVSLVLAYGGAILGSTLVAQRWLPRDSAGGLSRPVFSAHCAYWAVSLLFLWLAQMVKLLGDWRAGRAASVMPSLAGANLQLLISGAACVWLVCAFYGVLRHQGALPRARAAGVALLSFVVGRCSTSPRPRSSRPGAW